MRFFVGICRPHDLNRIYIGVDCRHPDDGRWVKFWSGVHNMWHLEGWTGEQFSSEVQKFMVTSQGPIPINTIKAETGKHALIPCYFFSLPFFTSASWIQLFNFRRFLASSIARNCIRGTALSAQKHKQPLKGKYCLGQGKYRISWSSPHTRLWGISVILSQSYTHRSSFRSAS